MKPAGFSCLSSLHFLGMEMGCAKRNWPSTGAAGRRHSSHVADGDAGAISEEVYVAMGALEEVFTTRTE